MNTSLENEIQLKLLKFLEKNPHTSQRCMQKEMGVSLGKINYCLSGLIEKGLIRIERFKKHRNKSAYMYRLTPKGFEQIAHLTINFLKLRIQEYDRIKKEIKNLSKQIDKMGSKTSDSAELIAEAEKRINKN